MLSKESPTYTYCNFSWCYTAWQVLQFIHVYPAVCSAEIPKGTCRIWIEVMTGVSSEAWKEFNKLSLQFLFWKTVQTCYAVLTLRDISVWKTLFAFKWLLSLPEPFPGKGTATVQMPSGIFNSNYLFEWDFKALREILHV